MADAASFHDGILVAPNPVPLRRAGWPLVAGISGDGHLGPLRAADPARVVRVPGANPDVDTPSDLAALAASGDAGESFGRGGRMDLVFRPVQDRR